MVPAEDCARCRVSLDRKLAPRPRCNYLVPGLVSGWAASDRALVVASPDYRFHLAGGTVKSQPALENSRISRPAVLRKRFGSPRRSLGWRWERRRTVPVNDHVYANDLDVFGQGSLFELLSTTRTAPGDAVLARWLRAPSDPQELPGRQEAIRELTPNLTLREDLAILGEDVRASIDNELLERWGVAPAVAFPPTARALALVLALSTIATGLLFLAGVLRLWPFAAVLAVNLILGAIFRKRVDLVLSSVEATGPDLCLERYLVERIEREPFHSDALLHIQHRLRIDGLNTSRHLRRLERWIELVDSSEHMLIRSLGVLVLWKQQIAMGVENWRRQYGRYIAGWLDAVPSSKPFNRWPRLPTTPTLDAPCIRRGRNRSLPLRVSNTPYCLPPVA